VPDQGWVTIVDAADPRLDVYRGLRDVDARHRFEAAHGCFVAEGVPVIRRLLQSPYPVGSVLALASRARQLEPDLERVTPSVQVFIASREVLAGVAGFDVHRGALAVGERLRPPPWQSVVAACSSVAVLEGLTDHENLGAVARSAAALGIDALLLDPTCADPLYRRCVRVSMGEILFLPWTRVEPWPGVLGALREAGFSVIALTPAATADEIDDVFGSTPGRIALLFGTEGPGLSAAALAAADRHARIPIRADVDSLNVGHAAAIAFHALRLARR
jgi:tRNA G18 (ribose-2'-O)-methylase SpoU